MEAIVAATEWIGGDPDPADRAALQALIDRASGGDAAARAELADAMAGPLVFGTAGLRGRVGAGRNRMNTAVVTTATAGLCTVLKQRLGPGFRVAIGYDARHRSAQFARTVAQVVVAAGGRASLLPRALPTPLLAFAVKRLAADAGVMITASHNPPADNGYKVYLGPRLAPDGLPGAQLVEPVDRQIQAAIAAAGPASGVLVADLGPSDAAQAAQPSGGRPAGTSRSTSAAGFELLGEQIVADYCAAAAELLTDLRRRTGWTTGLAGLRVVLTAMHGVGTEVAARVLRGAGLTDLHLVAAQCAPDPDFPTVAFPNPEEPGALDLAIETARTVDADLVVALDPDADRCSLAVPDAASPAGWRQLTGDQYGALLGELIGLAHAGEQGSCLARSIVSGSLLDRIAERHGLSAAQTLTGFKWIARAPGIVYGYEEAIGYCVNPEVVRDKDGITAALAACLLAAELKRAGSSLLARWDELACKYGLYWTAPLSFRVREPALIEQGLARLAAKPPQTLAGSPVIEFSDLAEGYRGLPPAKGYRLQTAADDRVVVRPSGTEPKLKCYLEVVCPVADPAALPAAERAASERIAQIKRELGELLGL